MRTSRIVVGLGYGDEGKGSWVDHLVRLLNIRHIIRFNGGSQAGHNVVTPEGLHHKFSQFGSGMFVPDTYTCLSRFMLIEPEAIFLEAKALTSKGVANPLRRVIASENAPIIPPFNRLLNQIQEMYRGDARHGSCGYGIGLTQGDVETLSEQALYLRDLADPQKLREKLLWLQKAKLAQAAPFVNADTESLLSKLRRTDIEFYIDLFCGFYHAVSVVDESEFARMIHDNDTVFEGAQGVLLDQHYGFFPHCTRSTCTFENAETLLREASFSGDSARVGLFRGYGTRHGSGPFITEDPSLEIASCHNSLNMWQGRFRLGWFDAVAARYALEVCGAVDTLAITNLDRMTTLPNVKIATRYENADSRFFTPNRINVEHYDYPTLATRTSSMAHIVPEYSEFFGFDGSDSARHGYLERLSDSLGHPIHAYSATSGPEKVYR